MKLKQIPPSRCRLFADEIHYWAKIIPSIGIQPE
jgi:hypothetical protein